MVVARYQRLMLTSVVGLMEAGMLARVAMWRVARRKAGREGSGKESPGTMPDGVGAPLVPAYVPLRLLPEASAARVPLASSIFQYSVGAGRGTQLVPAQAKPVWHWAGPVQVVPQPLPAQR